MAIINLRNANVSTSSQDEVTILNQQIVDLSAIVEVLDLNDLADVTIASAVDGELLVYNGTSGEWENTSALTPASVRMKSWELPDWTQFSYNLDDSVPLSINSNSISASLARRRTSKGSTTGLTVSAFYDYNSTTDSDWQNNGTGTAWLVADQTATYYCGNMVADTGSDYVTADGSGNLDTFNSRLLLRTYTKESGSSSPTRNDLLELSTSGSTLESDLTVTGNLQIDGSQIDFSNLPTSDPLVAGRLWNNSGILTISAG